MGRPTLSVMGVIYEALGFAVGHFGTVLRLSWLPVALLFLLDFVMIQMGLVEQERPLALQFQLQPGPITQFTTFLAQGAATGFSPPFGPLLGGGLLIAVILYASVMVPLVRYAAAGEVPHHRFMHLAFGPRHLKYVLAAAGSFAVVLIVAGALISVIGHGLGGPLRALLGQQVSSFEAGSLHAIDTAPAFGASGALVGAIDMWFLRFGIAFGTAKLIVAIPIVLVAGYVILRLFAYPYLVAAHRPDQGRALGAALGLSAGINVFSLMAIVALYAVISFATLWVSFIAIMVIFANIQAGSAYLISSYEAFVPDGDLTLWLKGGIGVLFTLVFLSLKTFLLALQAGLGGALVHAARRP
ncbi:trigger factor [Parvularcula bermudensis HTCC2503]|uniref:Trigger factor n=1 Tax=Parvularcula bermudensis (strain ATCC BAA-594 / HTCC2503 / KCTC 12087) TaxID=314260 RepID=E0TDX3_PARBH|nr:hypothetical protein [Parvularcula bermudensis]ADM10422.1 trigger factor [Parvularcula bermudensis HTCC2503]